MSCWTEANSSGTSRPQPHDSATSVTTSPVARRRAGQLRTVMPRSSSNPRIWLGCSLPRLGPNPAEGAHFTLRDFNFTTIWDQPLPRAGVPLWMSRFCCRNLRLL